MTDRDADTLEPRRHYTRISLELSSTWPGEMYLRFETDSGPAVMVAVAPGDVALLHILSAPGLPRVTR